MFGCTVCCADSKLGQDYSQDMAPKVVNDDPLLFPSAIAAPGVPVEQARSGSGPAAPVVFEDADMIADDDETLVSDYLINVVRSQTALGSSQQFEDRPETEIQGGTYTGQWLGDKLYGYGRIVRHDGFCYEGELINGRAHGRGKFQTTQGHVCEGQWENDMAHGEGSYHDIDGTFYEGEWVANRKSGEGYQQWPDKSSFKGSWLNGDMQHGVCTTAGGNIQYTGQLNQDKMHGYGVYNYNDGRIYTGNWEEGDTNGEGEMGWPDGSKYEGQFLKGKISGEGTLTWPDGRTYMGQWLNSRQHGVGSTADPAGKVKKHKWEGGKAVSESMDDPE